jgi:hypothetical protein
MTLPQREKSELFGMDDRVEQVERQSDHHRQQ